MRNHRRSPWCPTRTDSPSDLTAAVPDSVVAGDPGRQTWPDMLVLPALHLGGPGEEGGQVHARHPGRSLARCPDPLRTLPAHARCTIRPSQSRNAHC